MRRALKLWRVPGLTADEVCARFGLSRDALRRARKALAATVYLTEEDLVQMALLRASAPLAEQQILSFIDWVEHARWSEEQLAAILARLEAAGRVRRAPGGWSLSAEWP